MTTQLELITAVRDAANVNQNALLLVRNEAQQHYDAIRLWPNSGTRRDLMQQLASVITAIETAYNVELKMLDVAQESLQNLSPAPVPAPPTFPDGPVLDRRDVLQMAFRSSGSFLPSDGEFGRYLVTENLELSALASAAVSVVPATATAVIRVMRGTDLVARFTFPAGQSQATVEIIMPTVPKGNLLIFKAPSVQDASLAGVTGTLGAKRT